MAARILAATELATRCDPGALGVDAAASDAPARIVGQARAHDAVAFGIAMQGEGYHLFVMGPAGAGKRTLVRQAIDTHLARHGTERFDWAYVNNFARAQQPLALRLPAGRAVPLRQHMHELVDDLRTTIPAAFESEEYANAVERLNAEYKERAEQAVLGVGAEAARHGLVMVRTPMGLSFAPRKKNAQGEDTVLSSEEFEGLPEPEREQLKQALLAAQEQLVKVMRNSVRLRKEHADRLRALNRSMTLVAVEHAVDEVKAHYTDLPAVQAWLDAVRNSVLERADRFRSPTPEEGGEGEAVAEIDLSDFEVNVLVDAAGHDEVPVVTVDHPTCAQLIGRVDHLARMGTLVTDYRLIQPGALHRANGGYVLIDAVKLLRQPLAWDALKRALMRREIRIESLAEMLSLVSTVQLEPEPIPLAVKVVLFGEREIGELLQAYDEDFNRLFRVVADFGDDLPREPGTQASLARSLATRAQAQALLPPTADALATLIDHGAREAGDATRISAAVQRLLDVLAEADHIARMALSANIDRAHIVATLAARRQRAGRIDERLREEMARERLMIATSGTRVGQINGLLVYESGGETFGEPVRITATTRLGQGELIDIQRETHLGGPLHAKGVLILSSFLAARYSRFRSHAIHASLVFEQTYGYVEGDSASLAELVALLSSIADAPLRQGLAVTGSVNQFGDVQPIGGINQKIEGFFDLCVARGLDGTQGVVMPQANVGQLMLREDVIAAVGAGRFTIHAVRHVDEAVEVLTGLRAGAVLASEPDSVNGRIAQRLHEYARLHGGERRVPKRRSGERVLRAAQHEQSTP